jgi:hypothetical protein
MAAALVHADVHRGIGVGGGLDDLADLLVASGRGRGDVGGVVPVHGSAST